MSYNWTEATKAEQTLIEPPRPSAAEMAGPASRQVYAVDGARVTFDVVRGWRCECLVGANSLRCEHIKKAQALEIVRRGRE